MRMHDEFLPIYCSREFPCLGNKLRCNNQLRTKTKKKIKQILTDKTIFIHVFLGKEKHKSINYIEISLFYT